MLDNRTKSGIGRDRMEGELRAGIAGTGFIGAVHARSARLAGARVVARRRFLAPRAPSAPRPQLGAERALASAEELVRRPGASTWCTSAPPTTSICRSPRPPSPPASTSSARSRSPRRRRRASASSARRGRLRPPGRRAVRLPLLPDGARGARARRAAGETGAVRLLHGTYLQDWLLRPEDDNWRVDAELGGASRAFADIGSHWCDLAQFVSGHRITRVSARVLTAVPERVRASGRRAFAGGDAHARRGAPGHDRGRGDRAVRDRRRRARLGDRSARCRPAARTGCGSRSTAPRRRSRSTRRIRRSSGAGRREAATIIRRDPESLSPRGRALRDAAARPSAGIRRLLRRLRRRLLRRHPRPARRRTGCRCSPTACAPRGSPRPCWPPRASSLGRRGGRARARGGAAPMKLGFLTACMPERSLEDIAAWAGANGYEALELAAWPSLGDRPFTASHISGRRLRRGRGGARARRPRGQRPEPLGARLLRQQPAPGPGRARGRTTPTCAPASTPPRRWAAFPSARSSAATPAAASRTTCARPSSVFPPLVDYAGERGVRLMIENCVMEGWHPDGYPGNLAYSPELWEWMFELGLYLNYDPSHLLWLGIDPVAALKPYVDRVAHAHAKDAETFPERARPLRLLRPHLDPRAGPLGHGLVALPDPGARRGRLPQVRGHALRGRVRRRALGRARGPGVGRQPGPRRGGPADRPPEPAAAGGRQ